LCYARAYRHEWLTSLLDGDAHTDQLCVWIGVRPENSSVSVHARLFAPLIDLGLLSQPGLKAHRCDEVAQLDQVGIEMIPVNLFLE
jgi:hypothetical protein